MKTSVFLVLGIFVSSICFSQTRHIGNDDASSFESIGGTQIENYLLGTKYNLKKPGVLTSINLLGKATGSKVKMAIYSDNNNSPGNLVTSTKSVLVKSGVTSISVSTKTLSEGDYWIMAVYNTTGNHTYTNMDVEGKEVYYKALEFNTNIPSSGNGFIKSERGSDLAYFLEIEESSNLEKTKTDLKVYPNPASNYVFVKQNNTPISLIEVKDFTGNTVKAISVSRKNNVRLNINSLPDGVYFLVVNDNTSTQIIKR